MSAQFEYMASEDAFSEEEALRWERRRDAFRLYLAGYSTKDIAKRFNVTWSTIQNDIKAIRKRLNKETPHDLVAKQKQIISDMITANYEGMMRRDATATKNVRLALEHEAKLFGLYAPAQVNMGISDEDFSATLAMMMREIGAGPPRELHILEPEYGDRDGPDIDDQWVQG